MKLVNRMRRGPPQLILSFARQFTTPKNIYKNLDFPYVFNNTEELVTTQEDTNLDGRDLFNELVVENVRGLSDGFINAYTTFLSSLEAFDLKTIKNFCEGSLADRIALSFYKMKK